MKVLLIGPTGNVGSRLIPALLAHNHTVTVYVRNPSKLAPEALPHLAAIVTGSATDSGAIKAAILEHDCDAVVNAAGLAAPTKWHTQGDFEKIFASVVRGIAEAGQERRSKGQNEKPIRCWFMSGFGLLDSPKEGLLLRDYLALYPAHWPNYKLISSYPPSEVAWSLFCATTMNPKYPTPQYPPPPDTLASQHLAVKANSPPAWKDTFLRVPLIGAYLNIAWQMAGYTAVLEECVDLIAADLEKGLESEFVGKRVGAKEKNKVD